MKSGKKSSGMMNFAREAEKCDKSIMSVVNGEKNGIAAVAVGKCSEEAAKELCDKLSRLLLSYPEGRFACNFDEKGRVRFDLCGDGLFAAEGLKLLAESGAFGAEK